MNPCGKANGAQCDIPWCFFSSLTISTSPHLVAILCLEVARTSSTAPPRNFDYNQEMQDVEKRVAQAQVATAPTLNETGGNMTPIIHGQLVFRGMVLQYYMV